MYGEPIYENNEFFTAFPEADEVFYSEVEKERFLPLGTFHLQTDEGQHDVLIAAPIGDEVAMIGKENYGEYCGETWLTYSKVNGRWKLDCSADQLLDFGVCFEEASQIFFNLRRIFELNGFLAEPLSEVRVFPKGAKKIPLFQLQSYARCGYNWCGDIKENFSCVLSDVVDGLPKSPYGRDRKLSIFDGEGNAYTYLGYTFTKALAPDLFYFYNLATERVLVVHEFD
ncbi:hypothetical protein [Marinibactrum halimedae]|uniref:DUF4241 domain-containing protein n=1 Tax=Marinibactrum halimedae TaxID=1444977 RepID=A0AA37T4E8_9GAMM|nr:hypothetical protein [Marinibactrum halimedae]MCD9457698.1 hypothetical protein [Marinibactrum halimedae]GLS24928.1 hypothetical protein GCM10007877_06420 [Marinibactrum halimedae]